MTESRTRGLEDSPTDCSRSTVSSTNCNPQRTGELATDDLFEALSNSRRRHVIRALEDGDRDLGALARTIAAVECDIPVEEIDGQQRKRVYIGLHQTHLDQLERWGIVEWDSNHQTVAPGPAHEDALEAMRAVASGGDLEDDVDETNDPSLLGRALSRISGVRA